MPQSSSAFVSLFTRSFFVFLLIVLLIFTLWPFFRRRIFRHRYPCCCNIRCGRRRSEQDCYGYLPACRMAAGQNSGSILWRVCRQWILFCLAYLGCCRRGTSEKSLNRSGGLGIEGEHVCTVA
ncbi:hypothetical protein ACOMHN_065972 [Nucella lapillus]